MASSGGVNFPQIVSMVADVNAHTSPVSTCEEETSLTMLRMKMWKEIDILLLEMWEELLWEELKEVRKHFGCIM